MLLTRKVLVEAQSMNALRTQGTVCFRSVLFYFACWTRRAGDVQMRALASRMGFTGRFGVSDVRTFRRSAEFRSSIFEFRR
jgi:hypothetical protein